MELPGVMCVLVFYFYTLDLTVKRIIKKSALKLEFLQYACRLRIDECRNCLKTMNSSNSTVRDLHK